MRGSTVLHINEMTIKFTVMLCTISAMACLELVQLRKVV